MSSLNTLNPSSKRQTGGFAVRSVFASFLSGILSLVIIHCPLSTTLYAADSGVEFGLADDLSVMGTGGDVLDPDTEIKGFTVFGATQAAYPGASAGPGNVVVNGYLAVSSGPYFAGSSTFTSASGIYITGGNDNEVLAKNGANGPLKWTAVSALGDNLGNHTATTTLNMATFNMVNVGSITANAAITTYSSMTVAGNAFSVGGSTLVVKDGNVGIGTAAPAQKLDVTGSIVTRGGSIPSLFGTGAMVAYNPDSNGTAGSGFYVQIPDQINAFGGFALGYGTTTKWLYGMSKNIADTTALVFYEDALATQARMAIATGGNVGIGTTDPQAALDVNGGIRVRGSSTLPTAGEALRGTIYTLQGGTGVTDKIYICAKTSADTYLWILIGRGD